MSLIQSNLVSTGLFFLFIFLSGFWLGRTGRPYTMLLITLHKLRLFGNFRGGYPDLGVRACVRTLAPPNPTPFTPPKRGGAYGGKAQRTQIDRADGGRNWGYNLSSVMMQAVQLLQHHQPLSEMRPVLG